MLQGPTLSGGSNGTGGGGSSALKPQPIFQPAGSSATAATQIPSSGGAVTWNPLAGAVNQSSGGGGMNWRIIIILGALLFGVYAFGQSDNMIHVKSFPGSTVGAKVAAAQATCNPDTNIPCILVIDASLKATVSGTMPTLCAQCTLDDYRGGAESLSIKFLNGTPLADSFTGADACARIRAAALYAVANNLNQVDATHFAGVQPCATDIFAGICTSGVLSCNLTVKLGSTHLQSTVVQHITNSGVVVIGQGPLSTQIEYTGAAGAAAVMEIVDTTNGISGDQLQGIFLYGDAGNVTDALLLVGVHHSQFRDVYTWGVTSCGIHNEQSVTNEFVNARTSKWSAQALGILDVGHTVPQSLDCEDQNTVGVVTGPSSNDHFIDIAAEGLPGPGVHCIDALNTLLSGGTSEENTIGVKVEASCYTTTMSGMDLEGNTSNDVLDGGYFTSITSTETHSPIAASIELSASSRYATIIGDWTFALPQIDAGAAGYTYCVSGLCKTDGTIQVTGLASLDAGLTLGSQLLFNTAPTIASGFGTAPVMDQSNGSASFDVHIGTGGTAASGTLNMPAAVHSWMCSCVDISTQSATVFQCKEIGSTTNTVTLANYNTSGAQAAWGAGDYVLANCLAR